jgi:hypothetical protein
MILPNFIMIGAAKCGSTSLYNYLRQHPDVYMSPIEDANFFVLEGGAIKLYMPPPSEKLGRKWVHDLTGYAALFDGVQGQRAIGESSNIYLNFSRAAERIRHHCPDAKIMAILRNPVDRAFSNFLHLLGMGLEPYADFTEALNAEEKRMQEGWHPMWFYKQTSHYSARLQPYFDLFAKERIKIFLYDDLARDPVALLQKVYGFLGVDTSFRPDVSEVHKSTGVPGSKSLHKFLTEGNPLKTVMKALVPDRMRQNLRANAKKLAQRNLVKPSLPDETRELLIDEFREDVLRLQDAIGQDLSHWLRIPVREHQR